MSKKLLFLIVPFVLFSSCVQERSDIRVVCESSPPGLYLIKWETFPPMEGMVKIFESFVPDSFNLSSPIAETEINKGFKEIFFGQLAKRSYFKLVFDKKYSVITAERTIPMQELFNFRDLGGYYTANGKQTQWGKLYRSSSLANVTRQDVRMLKNLDIKTVIDFRTDRERYSAPSRYSAPQSFNFPLRGNPFGIYADRILLKKMKAGDMKVYAQDMFVFLLENNSDYFIKIFDILLDADNYPIVFNCSAGHERSAVVAALILAALDIDMDQIVNDYMLSNEQIDPYSILDRNNPFLQDLEIQETFTAMFRVYKNTITYSFDRIIKEYGSFDNYFSSELKLTPKKREKLKEIMFY